MYPKFTGVNFQRQSGVVRCDLDRLNRNLVCTCTNSPVSVIGLHMYRQVWQKQHEVRTKSDLGCSCWRIPIFPGRLQPSIFGTTELNFCVRNGNRWTLCVNLTNSAPSGIRTRDPLIKSQLLYQLS